MTSTLNLRVMIFKVFRRKEDYIHFDIYIHTHTKIAILERKLKMIKFMTNAKLMMMNENNSNSSSE